MSATVTALRERSRGRVAVELDGHPWRVVPADVVVDAGLAVGHPLDRERARALARGLRRADALARAARALAPRARSRAELARRLGGAGVPAAARDEALGTLERLGLVDDAAFARGRAEARARRGYGDAAIRDELIRLGVAPETAAEAVAALEPEGERCRRLLERRGGGQRELRRLAARGFDRETLQELEEFAAGT